MQPLLSLQDISYSYHNLKGETPALSNISFQVSSGEFLAVVGPSGCGKSTLLSIIAGLLKPEQGNLFYKGRCLADCGSKDTVTIGYMLQRDHLFEWRTIYQNVTLGLELNQIAITFSNFSPITACMPLRIRSLPNCQAGCVSVPL